MKKALMIIAIVAIVVITGSMIYYYVFFRPGIEKAEIGLQEQKLELEKEKQRDEELKEEQEKLQKSIEGSIKQQGLERCLGEVYQEYDRRMGEVNKTYIEAWNDECERLGLKPDSALPGEIADGLNEEYQREVDRTDKAYENDKDDCYKFWQD